MNDMYRRLIPGTDLHVASSPAGVRFSTGDVAPVGGDWLMYVDVTQDARGALVAVGIGALSDHVWVMRPTGDAMVLADRALGNFSVKFRQGYDELYVQHGFTRDGDRDVFRSVLKVYDLNGTYLRDEPALYDPYGIRRIEEPSGRPVMATEARGPRTLILNGVVRPVYFYEELDGWALFGIDADLHGVEAYVTALRDPQGVVTMCPYRLDHPAQLSVVAGLPYVAINADASISPEPSACRDWPRYQPYVPPPVVPRVPPQINIPFPKPPATMPAFWFGVSDDERGPGNCQWSAAPGDTRPVTEGSAWAETIEGRDLLHGLWLSDNNNPPETVDAEIEFVKAQGAKAVYLHCDDVRQELNLQLAADRVFAAGLVPILAAHASDNIHAVNAQRERFYVEGRTGQLNGLTFNSRAGWDGIGGYTKDLERFRDTFVAIVETLCKSGRIDVMYLYGWGDLGGPLYYWPAFREYVEKLAARIPTPTEKPGPPLPPQAPVTPVAPPEPTPPPKDRDRAQTTAVVLAASAPFWIWLWRKIRRKK